MLHLRKWCTPGRRVIGTGPSSSVSLPTFTSCQPRKLWPLAPPPPSRKDLPRLSLVSSWSDHTVHVLSCMLLLCGCKWRALRRTEAMGSSNLTALARLYPPPSCLQAMLRTSEVCRGAKGSLGEETRWAPGAPLPTEARLSSRTTVQTSTLRARAGSSSFRPSPRRLPWSSIRGMFLRTALSQSKCHAFGPRVVNLSVLPRDRFANHLLIGLISVLLRISLHTLALLWGRWARPVPQAIAKSSLNIADSTAGLHSGSQAKKPSGRSSASGSFRLAAQGRESCTSRDEDRPPSDNDLQQRRKSAPHLSQVLPTSGGSEGGGFGSRPDEPTIPLHPRSTPAIRTGTGIAGMWTGDYSATSRGTSTKVF